MVSVAPSKVADPATDGAPTSASAHPAGTMPTLVKVEVESAALFPAHTASPASALAPSATFCRSPICTQFTPSYEKLPLTESPLRVTRTHTGAATMPPAEIVCALAPAAARD